MKDINAVTGFDLYGNKVLVIAKSLKILPFGEPEIGNVNRISLEQDNLSVGRMITRGYAYLDIGFHESMTDANNFIQAIETSQQLNVACPREVAYRQKFISA